MQLITFCIKLFTYFLLSENHKLESTRLQLNSCHFAFQFITYISLPPKNQCSISSSEVWLG